MVYIQDEGSFFDAPLGVVWEYNLGGEEHDRAHRTTRNAQFKPLSPTSLVYSAERNWGARWIPESSRITILQPLSMVTEMLEGPLVGSKMVYVYKPRGERTQVDVYGDFVSATIPSVELESTVLRWLESEFNEDAPAVRALASRKRAPARRGR